jgi:hypothetical protein
MKTIAMCLLLICNVALAGPEVPWPEADQREVFVQDLQGLWGSFNLNNPQQAFQIKVQEANFNLSCPYVVTVTAINPYSGEASSKDIDVICSSFPRKVTFILSNESDDTRQYVEIVGLWKDKSAQELGRQYLGITVYNYGEFKEKVYQDIFYKISE